MANKEVGPGGGTHKARKGPDTPTKKIGKAGELSTFIPTGGVKPQTIEGLVEVKPDVDSKGYSSTRGITVVPIFPKPLVDPKEIPNGGGRCIGGGTSDKSLRKARKDAGMKKRGGK